MQVAGLHAQPGQKRVKTMSLPDGASFAAGEMERVVTALSALEADTTAPRSLEVRVLLHVHREYPKMVTTGTNENGSPVQVVVGSEAEEQAARAKVAVASTPAEQSELEEIPSPQAELAQDGPATDAAVGQAETTPALAEDAAVASIPDNGAPLDEIVQN